jgi:hypothetical protein
MCGTLQQGGEDQLRERWCRLPERGRAKRIGREKRAEGGAKTMMIMRKRERR